MKKMNKKLLIAVLCIVLGCVTLFATAFASSGGSTGYDAFKEALKNTAAVKSVTADVNLSVKDNGTVLMSSEVTAKENHNGTQSSSVTGSVNSQDRTEGFEAYNQDGKTILKSSNSDVYSVMEKQADSRFDNMDRSGIKDPQACKAAETIVDAIAGDLKNYFTTNSKADGSKTIDFDITGNQIPALVNAVVSLGAENSKFDHQTARVQLEQSGMPPFMQGFDKDKMPKLTDNVRIDEIALSADVDASGKIVDLTMSFNISGKDEQGIQHSVTAEMDAALSGFDNTTPDTVSLEGKKTQTIDPATFTKSNMR